MEQFLSIANDLVNRNQLVLAVIVGSITIYKLLNSFRPEINKWIERKGINESPGTDVASASSSSDVDANDQFRLPTDSNTMSESDTLIDEPSNIDSDTDWFAPFEDRDYSRAAALLKKKIAKETDPDERILKQNYLGLALFNQDQQKAADYFDDLLENGSKDISIYTWYSNLFYYKGNYRKSISIIQDGIKNHESNAELPWLLARALHKNGDTYKAAEILMQNINLHPAHGTSYRQLALLLVDIDMLEHAINACLIGMRECPQDAGIIEEYANIIPDQDSEKNKFYAYKLLTEIDSNNSRYWMLLGNEYLNLNLNDLALEAYKKANSLEEEKDSAILANIGNIMKNRGFFTHGADYLKQAVSIDADDQYAHERLGQSLKMADDERNKRDDIESEVRLSLKSNGTLQYLLALVQNKLSPIPE